MSTAADPNTTDGLVDVAPSRPSSSRTVDGAADTPSRSAADQFMRQLLRLPEGTTSTAAQARSAFQKSLAFTTCRCLLMYIILPFVLPAVGIASGVGPAVGIVVGVLAMVSIVYSIRRFWRADHSKRWHYTVFGSVIIGFLIYLTIKDFAELL